MLHGPLYLSARLLQPRKASVGLHLPLVTSRRLCLRQLHGNNPKEPPARAEVPPALLSAMRLVVRAPWNSVGAQSRL